MSCHITDDELRSFFNYPIWDVDAYYIPSYLNLTRDDLIKMVMKLASNSITGRLHHCVYYRNHKIFDPQLFYK